MRHATSSSSQFSKIYLLIKKLIFLIVAKTIFVFFFFFCVWVGHWEPVSSAVFFVFMHVLLFPSCYV